MKLLATFNYWEGEFLLKNSKILNKEIIFKDKKQSSILYQLEFNDKRVLFAFLGMTQIFSMPSLQKIIDNNKIDSALVFGSAGSYECNIGKIVIINKFSYENEILKKYFDLETKLPVWYKKNLFSKIEIFKSISVNDIKKSDKDCQKICFDMESAEIAYLLKLNKINSSFFRIVTDKGDINFEKMKYIYKSNTDMLLKIIELFIG